MSHKKKKKKKKKPKWFFPYLPPTSPVLLMNDFVIFKKCHYFSGCMISPFLFKFLPVVFNLCLKDEVVYFSY